MKRCLLHAREWKKADAEVYLHAHHYHGGENDLDSGVGRIYDFKKKPDGMDKILFILSNFLNSPVLYARLFSKQVKLFPNFDLTYFLYCAGRGVVIDNAIKKIKPNIIVSETGSLQTLVAVMVAKNNKLPIVFENYAEIQFKAKADGINIAPRYEKLWKYILDQVDMVVPASEHCAIGPKKYLDDHSKIHVVYSGISFDVFYGRMLSNQKEARIKFNLPIDKYLIMAVGALKMRKGHDQLFESLLKLDVNVRNSMAVVLCGMGDILELKARAEEIGFPDENLKIFQALSEQDLAELYSAVDCFCFPSITPRECMGMAMKEAMAVGLPVVAYDTGGIKEAVENNVNGILVKTGDKQALADVIYKMSLISEDQKKHYRELNSKKAKDLFDIKKTSVELFSLLLSVTK